MTRKLGAVGGWRGRREVPLVVIRETNDRDVPRLLALYADSEPVESPPSRPPVREGERLAWLSSVLHRGINFAAEEEGHLVGHLVLIRVGDAAEMSVFVHRDFRHRGIGSTLVRVAIDQARDMGLRHIWVTISPEQTTIQEALLGFGFAVSSRSGTKTELVLSL